MRDRKAKPRAAAKPPAAGAPSIPDAAEQAFDVWLHRGLHKLYDDVADQPLPPELLRMIEADRKARGGK